MFETTVPSQQEPESTRERLLESAGEVFAERGFADATVREICTKAGANVAAVNYYFGSKERLYSAVLQYADERSMRKHPEFPAEPADLDAEGGLAMFIKQFVRRVFDTGVPAWHDQVIAREMVSPTPALAELAERNIKPRALMLQRMVRELLGDSATDADVQMCAASVVGQCMLYHRCKMMVEHLMPAIDMESPGAADAIAEHVTRFSLDAIRARGKRPSTTTRDNA